jgi:hypothetical protein
MKRAAMPPDAIEKALAYKIVGIKGVYIRAEYAEQRIQIMQAWGDFVLTQIDDATRFRSE